MHSLKLAAFALAAAIVSAPAVAEPAPQPKLIVAISVDQLSGQLFGTYRPHFTGGLKRLSEGAVFARSYQAHGITETCPGHSTILTGAHPARTGIVANNWVDFMVPRNDKRIYCAEDERVPGSTSDAYTVSSSHLRVPALGDRMKAADPEALVVAVAGKDRSAVMMGGKAPDQRWFWQDGRFVSPAGKPAPAVVAKVNASIAGALSRSRLAMAVPPLCASKNRAIPVGEGKSVGTYRFDRAARDAKAFGASPELDAATLAMAAALSRDLNLGQDDHADLLAISLSATDYVGHRYGTNGVEMCLQLLTLDADLGAFFDVLDQSGVAYAVVLTADHGGADLPERQRLEGVADAERVDPAAMPQGVGEAVAARLGLPEPVFAGRWYIRPSVPAARRGEVLAEASAILRAHRQVAEVYGAEQVRAHRMPTGPAERWSMLDRLRASYDPERSGDLFVVYRENVTPIADGTRGSVATHGTLWDYDRNVPILFWWKGIAPEEHGESAMTVDIMPTLASLIGLAVPSSEIDGHCLDILAGPESNCGL